MNGTTTKQEKKRKRNRKQQVCNDDDDDDDCRMRNTHIRSANTTSTTTTTTSTTTTNLRVILFASGSCLRSERFQPFKDDSQWWNRHDALVRCTASFLFSTSSSCSTTTSTPISTTRELIILFDDDWSRIHMKYDTTTTTTTKTKRMIPTEYHILSLWKRVTQLQQIQQQSHPYIVTDPTGTLSCQLILPPSMTSTIITTKSFGGISDLSQKKLKVHYPYQPPSSLQPSLQPTVVVGSNAKSSVPRFMNQDINQDSSSKRDVLLWIQQNCSMEYLRENKLNIPLEVSLRKYNRDSIWNIYMKWMIIQQKQVQEKQQQQQQIQSTSYVNKKDPVHASNDHTSSRSKNTTSLHYEELERVVHDLIIVDHDTNTRLTPTSSTGIRQVSTSQQQQQQQKKNQNFHHHHHNIMVVTLHESSENELPCWNNDPIDSTSSSSSTSIVVFLGAVRDMTTIEHDIVKQICYRIQKKKTNQDKNDDDENQQQQQQPNFHVHGPVPVRIGPVAEFTSKIITLLSFHHTYDRLRPALEQLVSLSSLSRENAITTITSMKSFSSIKMGPPHLHMLCFVDLDSTDVSYELQQRSETLWCLVRVIVTSLWRSKLAGGSNSSSTTGKKRGTNPLQNSITLWFQDDKILHFHQDDFVRTMAEKHQAAPSEYQILQCLCTKIQNLNTTDSSTGKEKEKKQKKMKHIVKNMLDTNILQVPTCIWDVEDDEQQQQLTCISLTKNNNNDSFHDKNEKNLIRTDFGSLLYQTLYRMGRVNHSNRDDNDNKNDHDHDDIPIGVTDTNGLNGKTICTNNTPSNSNNHHHHHGYGLVILNIPFHEKEENLSLQQQKRNQTEEKLEKKSKFMKSFIKYCSQQQVGNLHTSHDENGKSILPIVRTGIHKTKYGGGVFGVDTPAVVVTLLQHCCYQYPSFFTFIAHDYNNKDSNNAGTTGTKQTVFTLKK